MIAGDQISVVHNEPLTLFLAMQREVSGRMPWELCLLHPPHTPEVGQFAAGMRMLRAGGVTELPIELARAADVRSFATFPTVADNPDVARGWELIRRSMSAVETELRGAIESYDPSLEEAKAYIESTLLSDERCLGVLCAALGVRPAGRPLPIYLTPFAPFPPGTAFLTERGAARSAYLDYRRYAGPVLLESVLTLLSWHLLTVSPTDTVLSRMVAGTATGTANGTANGGDPVRRRLRTIVMKLLIAWTTEHLVAAFEPGYRGTVVAFGLDLRYPRLLPAIRSPWLHYLQGRTTREKALDLINERLAGQPASWFIEQIDASSLAADFYLLEWLAAQGDAEATARLAEWQPRFAADLVRHLDFAVGAELAHYDGIPLGPLAPDMAAFVRETCTGNSLLRWPQLRRRAGSTAYRMAEAAFDGPGAEYGGEAWAPIARLLAQYADGVVSERVFIDQCLTLEHNNGCLFDKFFDTWEMQATLAAQARGDLGVLGEHASAEVRGLLRRHLGGDGPAADPRPGPAHLWPRPGRAGCGNRAEPREPGAEHPEPAAKPLWRGTIRKPHGREVPKLRSVRVVLHTDLGPMALRLRPDDAPMAVGTFVELARGEVAWRDPATGGMSTGPFYDGTRFHRIVPDFILQAGDRTETGRGGPGFRYDEEPTPARFDRPYLVGMVNTGVVTNGSQFFVTLAEAPHLDGQYTIIGEVADEPSRDMARRLSDAARAGRSDLRIVRVEVDAT